MNLWTHHQTNIKRKTHKWDHYLPVYERHLERFRNQSVVLFEIGCGLGGSLQMWKDSLGPFVQVVGIDVKPECKRFEENQIAVRVGAQQDFKFLKSLIMEFGPPDIVIDDGSHQMPHIEATFRYLYPLMPKNGVYIAEDLHTCYWDEYQGGLKKPGSFIEIAKDLIDELNAYHTREQVEETTFSKETMSMHFYDSMLVLERGRYVARHSIKIGTDM